MTDLFRMTDVDDVQLDSIRFLFPCFYLSFGMQDEMNLWNGGFFVDGAYVDASLWESGLLSVILSTRRKDVDYKKMNFILERDRYFYFPLMFDTPGTTVGQAIDVAVQKEQPFRPHDVPDTSGLYSVGDRNVIVIDRGKLTQVEVARENSEGFPTFRAALRLIVNGICYLSSEKPDIEYKYPDETPRTWIEILEQSTRKADIKRAKQALNSLGIYSKIHFCGESIRVEYEGLPTGRELSPHWRRGHWRNQAHGEGLSLRKLIWIKPTLVRRDKGEPEKGHIYQIEPSD